MQSITKTAATTASHSLNNQIQFLLHQIWPLAMIVAGLILTGVWGSLLGYSVIKAGYALISAIFG